MTGYVLSVVNIEASVCAVASAIFPAIAAVLAYLREKVLVSVGFLLLGVYGLSYSPESNIKEFLAGLCKSATLNMRR